MKLRAGIGLAGLLAVAAIIAGVWLCARTKQAPVEPLNLVVATDLHDISPSLTDHGQFFTEMVNASDGKVMQYSDELVQAFVQQVIAESPDAVILSGDLTFNGAKQSHLDLAQRLQPLVDAGIPVLVLPGNHDLYKTNAAAFQGDGYTLVEGVSAEEFAEIYAGFGYDTALARDAASLSYHTVSTDVSRWAQQTAQTEENLLHFTDYSKQFFYDTAYHQAISEVGQKKAGEHMAAFFAQTNADYFAGRTDEIDWGDASYKRWQQTGDFYSIYLSSMTADKASNFNAFAFSYGRGL